MVIPGEDSRNKQLREIQQLLASAPIVVNLPLAPNSSSVIPSEARNPSSSNTAEDVAQSKRDSSSPSAPRNDGSRVNATQSDQQSSATGHHSAALVLPSVPVDQLLDDHAVEFEECKRWANSEAGQSARMTNPAGFANVRARAEAHLRAMSQSVMMQPQSMPKGKV